jgi:hypothetical protein
VLECLGMDERARSGGPAHGGSGQLFYGRGGTEREKREGPVHDTRGMKERGTWWRGCDAWRRGGGPGGRQRHGPSGGGRRQCRSIARGGWDPLRWGSCFVLAR